ncbi:MAG: carboxylating nicotinate-nucleotide diphosphorylase [Actinobacteria bacterium]|nr:carboxylating nicotinate-nucleotide diphosphorylase [Actinomycetota bacterium]
MVMLEINEEIIRLVDKAIEEDLVGGIDVTSVATIPEGMESVAKFVAKAEGVIAGIEIAGLVMRRSGVAGFEALRSDGDSLKRGDLIATASGDTRSILLSERTALNFMTHLSGIATLTSRWVSAVAGTKAKIRDTRKTTPGLRTLEKYAVRLGGGVNHRFTLSEQALIKDNHIAASGSLTNAFASIRREFPDIEVEVEVDNLDQLREALGCGATLIMLDNMDLEMTIQAVKITAGQARLESSGGLSLENARAYAMSGVDFLAVGALTHSAPALDISLDISDSNSPSKGSK